MPHDVFLSYSTRDRTIAEAVCGALERRDVSVWMAPRDIAPGASWAGSIVEAIDDARAVVLIFSNAANESTQIEREVQRALEKNLTVIPFRIEDVKPTEALAYCIGAVQWLDAFNPPLEPHCDALAKVVRRKTRAAPNASEPRPAPERAPPPAEPPPAPARTDRGRTATLAIGGVAAVAAAAVAAVVFWKDGKQEAPITTYHPPPIELDPPTVGKFAGTVANLPNVQQTPANALNVSQSPAVVARANVGAFIQFSSDPSSDSAAHEVGKVGMLPMTKRADVYVFRANRDSWVSLARFASQADRDANLPIFRKTWPSAFAVDQLSWCPDPSPPPTLTKAPPVVIVGAEIVYCGP